MTDFIIGFYAGAALTVPSGYVVGKQFGAFPIPYPILAAATLFWPMTVALGLAAVAGARKM